MTSSPPVHSYAARCAQIEKKWQNFWHTQRSFEVQETPDKPKYYVLDMFPYPSGQGLHVGHPLGYIASDIIARSKWLEGYCVLHPMGFDAFGLPAEQYAIQTRNHPKLTTQAHMARYESQLRKIGFAYDWSRKIATCDPATYQWTQWIFIALYHHYYCPKHQKARPISELISHLQAHGSQGLGGDVLSANQFNSLSNYDREMVLQRFRLAYLDDAFVNWCDELGTVLANDEVKDGLSVRGGHPVRQKKLKHWKLRVSAYAQRLLSGLDSLDWSESLKSIQRHWLGKSVGTQVHFVIDSPSHSQNPLMLKVFTSRADTIYGVTFLVIAPEHPLVHEITTTDQKEHVHEYIQKVCESSRRLTSTTTPTGVFTGGYGLHPLTGEPLEIWISEYVLMDYGEGAIMAVPADDSRDQQFAEHFGLRVISNHKHQTELEEMSIKQGCALITTQLEGKKLGCAQETFRLRDAIFSRQRYWGEPIPIYYKDNIPMTLDPQDLPLELPEIDDYAPKQGQPPLATVSSWATPEGYPLEYTTMPGYAGSSAYYLRYMDPHNSKQLVGREAAHYWQDVDLYVGGAEHATGHLIYARFWNMFLYDLGISATEEPFRKLLNQGMILGQSQYVHRIKGRQTFVSYGLHHQHSTQRIPVNVAFVHKGILDQQAFKAWRDEFADAEFILDNNQFLCESVVEKMSKSLYNTITPDEIIDQYGADTLRIYEMFLGPIDQTKPWSSEKITGAHRFLSRFWRLFFNNNTLHVSSEEPTSQERILLHKTIKAVRESTETFHFNVAISVLMSTTNELHKLKCYKRDILFPLVILIAPYCPHLAEELYEQLGGQPSIFHHARWPDYDPILVSDSVYELPISINGKVKFKIMVPHSATEDQIKQLVESHHSFKDTVKERPIIKWIIRPQAIVNLVIRP